MTAMAPPVDVQARRLALDGSRSFIVRAPAGSGKTRLLIQRYLALLARVDEPEEIVAITFTRKAAGEMKQRVLDAFAAAKLPDDGNDGDTRRLALDALQQDRARGWQLTSNAQRLRMQTIDALNASITRQMPLLARFGAQPESVENASAHYREAARELLAEVNVGDDAAAIAKANDIATLLLHLDNNLAVAETLLADVLRSRDHWLRSLHGMQDREVLEATLARVRGEACALVAQAFPSWAKSETLALARFAGQNLAAEVVDIGLSAFLSEPHFPGGDESHLPRWLALAEILLIKDGSWRRQVNKRIGFPIGEGKTEKAHFAEMKQRMQALLETLSAEDARPEESVRLATRLQQLRALPAPGYSDGQWEVLGAIVRLLPHATAMLWQVFGRHSQCDFTEIAQAAARALGADDAPTDLALALDYRLRHLLVDEFQDTSFAQFELLEKLTRGWSEGDGRSLFLVGDPMQSIYRFREAEVSLFSRAWQEGLGGVHLNALNLCVNFRSRAGIVEWVNATFSALMPTGDNTAVPYAASVAFATQPSTTAAVTLHAIRRPRTDVEPAANGELDEALRVIDIITATRATNASAQIAILVRNRGHLREIVPALKAANIVFRAVDIDPLRDRPVVSDLLALTRALLHPADRIAWLAILRAPWCGLTLNDLAILAGGATPVEGELRSDTRSLWEIINDHERVSSLTADGARRVGMLLSALEPAMQRRRRASLRDTVEDTWLKLRGPASLARAEDLDDAATLFALLDDEAAAQASGGQVIDLDALESRVDRLFAGTRESVTAEPPIQIMTIHKAKGLEFDTVIIPSLHRPPRHDAKKLIVWTEQINAESGELELLLAPIQEIGSEGESADDADSIYRYVLLQERLHQREEIVRLMYVAATRAIEHLHLLGVVAARDESAIYLDSESTLPPRAESLLAALWPALSVPFLSSLDAGGGQGVPQAATNSADKRPMRISAAQPLVPLPPPQGLAHGAVVLSPRADFPAVDFDWASDAARHIGTVVHAFLQRIAEEGLAAWPSERIGEASAKIMSELRRLGVANKALPDATARASNALVNALGDERGRWVLQAHRDARTEWRLTGVVDGALLNVAIDRSFTAEDGTRWIIDFKTGNHEGANVDAFLDNERLRYAPQLETYARMLDAVDGSAAAIKLGLYFPMLKGWRAWDAGVR